jgi:hypothetical protein
MKKSIIVAMVFTMCYSVSVVAQKDTFNDYLVGKHKIEKRSMLTLTSWGGLNLTSGIIGMYSSNGESSYFHQMNAAWGAINMSIGISALLIKAQEPRDLKGIVEQDHRLEKILYINTGLDVAYVTAGLLFRAQAQNDNGNYQRFMGFGNSLLIQGGFLFAFDLAQIIINSRYRKANASSLWKNLSLSNQGIGLKYTIR